MFDSIKEGIGDTMPEYKDRGGLCMGCMNPLPEGRRECGICGYPANGNNEPMYLPVGTILSDRYVVGKLLDHVGDAAVYIGFDRVLKSLIIMREFFPDTLVERAPDGEIQVISGCENTFRDYYEKFRVHARALARMRELSSVVALYDIFDQNRTAYTISEYCEGNTLETRLKQVGGRMNWDEARPLFMPLLSSLISLHSAGVFHLGISPNNIIVGSDGKLHLQGFSIPEARRVSTDLRPHLIAGYSAPEQYDFGQDIGAWSDVYGLAATIFRTLTGNPPPEGSRRAKDSNDLFVPSEIAAEMPDYIAAALFNALQVKPDNRIRSIEHFRDQLSTAPAVSRLRENEDQDPQNTVEAEEEEPVPEKKNNRAKYAMLIVLAVFVFLLLLAGTTLLIMFPDLFRGGEETSSTPLPSLIESTTTSTTTTQTEEASYATPGLVGKSYYDVRESNLIGGMKVEVEYKVYSDRPIGEIIKQTPNAETPAAAGATIKVIISDGPKDKLVPDLSGWNSQQAEQLLKSLGFRVTISKVYSETYDIDIVESVQEAGKSLEEGSMVTLRVSETKLTTTTQPTEATNWWDNF